MHIHVQMNSSKHSYTMYFITQQKGWDPITPDMGPLLWHEKSTMILGIPEQCQ